MTCPCQLIQQVEKMREDIKSKLLRKHGKEFAVEEDFTFAWEKKD